VRIVTNRITQEAYIFWTGDVDRFAMPDRAVLERPDQDKVQGRLRVDGATFEQLLISNRRLERCDSPNNNQLGLYDPETRICYWVDQADLFQLLH